MLNIIFEYFDENVNIETLSRFIFKVYHDRGELKESIVLKTIKNELNELKNSFRFIIFYAYSNDDLLGILLLSVNYPKFGIIWDWQPLVLPSFNEDKIAKKLIESCLEYAKESDIVRFEICFTMEDDVDKKSYQRYKKWYKASGFYKVMEEVSMILDLDTIKVERISFPRNIEIKGIDNIKMDELIAISKEVYENSQDIMYLDLSNDLKNTVATEWFNIEKPMLKESSKILCEHEQIIGFLISRPIKNDAQINSFGLLPAYRNKGLGKKLLLYGLEKAKEKGFRYIHLDVAMENVPAYKLYSNVGFRRKFSSIIYAFKLNKKLK